MSISRIKQIKRIIAEHDVRDPRAALFAIEEVLKQPNPEGKQPKPLMQVALVRTDQKTVACLIKFDKKNLKPRHLGLVIDGLNDFGNDVFGKCEDPNCPVHGINKPPAASDLDELFKKFEAEQRAKNKGGVQ